MNRERFMIIVGMHEFVFSLNLFALFTYTSFYKGHA